MGCHFSRRLSEAAGPEAISSKLNNSPLARGIKQGGSMTEVTAEKKKKDPGYEYLCAALLLNIASFVIGDTPDDLDDRCLEQPPADEFDSDEGRSVTILT